MPTRNVVLTDHQALMVEQLVTSGRYQNASEVLREGLRLVEQREAEDAYRLEALRAAVQIGVADIQAGRFKAFDTKASLRAHLQSLTDPTTTASATLATAAARSGVRMPKPTATGRPDALRTRVTCGATTAASASFTPVTPATET